MQTRSNFDCTGDSEKVLEFDDSCSSRNYIIGIDVGTTNIRSYIYDRNARVVGKSQGKVDLICHDDQVEINPDSLWQSFTGVVKGSLKAANLNASAVAGLGISTQRGTFVTWDRVTGAPLHNFITWKDKRAEKLSREWNSSFKMKMIRYSAFLLYILTGNKRYYAGSKLKLTSALVLMRLAWVFQNIPLVEEKCRRREVLFGTIDTWLVWKLTGGIIHATDSSNASVLGFFDPFKMEWNKLALSMLQIPTDILPTVMYTSDSYGETLAEIFGSPISISSVVGDQQASMFGQCCFNVGDVNCTLGTGTFLCLNTGSSPCASLKGGTYPTVGWTINGKTTYLLECGTADTGTVIDWGQSLGFYEKADDSSSIALSVQDSGGVYFLPAYSKSKNSIPHFNSSVSAFVGIRSCSSKGHLVRAILEALCFQMYSLFKSLLADVPHTVKKLSVSGGVSKNDFVVQVITNLVSVPVSRSKHFDTSSLGAALLAGLHLGIWKDKEEFFEFPKSVDDFSPKSSAVLDYKLLMNNWEKVAIWNCMAQ